MKNNQKNNQKGITLIALVVTIIVLLILAGVSIAMLTGQNGILNKASEASWETKLGDAEDLISLTAATYQADFLAWQYTDANADIDWNNTELKTELNKEDKAIELEDVIHKACIDSEKSLGSVDDRKAWI